MPDWPAKPLVSIVIPVYNGADYLGYAIDSALAQTWPNTEVIVVNDGSDDQGRTAAVAARYGDRIRYIEKPNGGVATAINRGISLMRGEYFSWLSHDDVYPPGKLDRMMRAVLEYGGPVVAFGDFVSMDRAGRPLREVRTGRGFDGSMPFWAVLEGRLNGCAMLIPKECFRVCGYFRPDLPATQDYDLWFRMASKFPFLHVPGVMVHQREHEQQGSKSPRFRSEVDLLCLSILDRITPEIIESHASSELEFYGRAQRWFESEGSAAALRREIRRISQPLSVAAVIPEALPVLDAESLSGGLASPDTDFAEVSFFRSNAEDWRLLTGIRADRQEFQFKSVLGEPESILAKLRSLTAGIESGYVWLAPSFRSIQTLDPWPPLEKLLVSPEAAACIRYYPDGRLSPGSLGVLEGAVLRTDSLRAALNDATASLTSLIHALSRYGSIKASVVVDEESCSSPAQSAPPANCGGESFPVPATDLTRVGRAWIFLSRRSPLSTIAAQAIWRLCGTGQFRNRLMQWTGLHGRFDADWYRRRYRDVAAAGIDPVYHYLMFGRQEDRDPSPAFSAKAYLADHGDIAGGSLPAVQHYLLWGHRERRRVRPAVLRYSPLPDGSIDDRPGVLFVLSVRNRDAVRFVEDLSLQVSPRIRGLCLRDHGDGTASIGTTAKGSEGSVFELPLGVAAITAEAHALGVRRIMVVDSSSFPEFLPGMLQDIRIPFDVVHLAADIPAADCCGAEGRPSTPHEFARPGWLLKQAQKHFALSNDSARRLSERGVQGSVIVAQPPDPYRLRSFRVWGRPSREAEPLRVALFGSIDGNSGLQTVMEVLTSVRIRSLPLRFMVFGEIAALQPFSDICRIVSIQNHSALTSEVCRWHPHIAWFPYRAPMAHCYQLTDAQANGLPVAATAIGELPERLQHRPLSWLLPPGASAGDWTSLFLRLRRDGMPTEWEAPVDAPALRDDHNLYQRYLYNALHESSDVDAKKAK